MRTIRDLGVPQDGDNAKWPNGAIRNETATDTGTPVVKEIYNDIIANIYKIIVDTGIEFTETEDSELSQHQLLDALKVFSNTINDLQQLLTIDALDINLLMNLDSLPDDYVFIGKVTDNITAGENYTVIGTGNLTLPLTSDKDIVASSLVVVVLNSAGSKMVSLSTEAAESVLHTAFGTPITYNESNNLLYFSDGNILTDFPKVHNVESLIQVTTSLDVKIVDTILIKGKLICFTYNDVLLKYQAFSFDEGNLDVLEGEINIPDLSGVDNQPYMYSDGEFLYFTNTETVINESVNNYTLGKFSFDEILLTITSVSFSNLSVSFNKTTNVFINKDDGFLFTFINGSLNRFSLAGGLAVLIGLFNTINGVVFKHNSQTYYSNGNVATKWNY